MTRHLSILPAVLLTLGCSVDAVDPAGRLCPCDEGWICVAGACRPEGYCGGGGEYRVTGLAAEWATPHVVHWTWSLAEGSDPGGLSELVVVIGEAEADAHAVERCACSIGRGESCDPASEVRVITAAEYAELGDDTLVDQTMGIHEVREVATLDLSPDTRYAAIVVALDQALAGELPRSSATEVAFAETSAVPAGTITVFDETQPAPAGWTLPGSCFAHDGGHRHVVRCPPVEGFGECKTSEDPCPASWPGGEPDLWLCEPDVHPRHADSCWINFRWADLGLPAPIFPGRFHSAYVEIDLDMRGVDVGYAELTTTLESGGSARSWSDRGRGGTRLRGDGRGHRYEIPLQVLFADDDETRRLTSSDLPSRDLRLHRFRFGANFAHGTEVHFRSVRIRH